VFLGHFAFINLVAVNDNRPWRIEMQLANAAFKIGEGNANPFTFAGREYHRLTFFAFQN